MTNSERISFHCELSKYLSQNCPQNDKLGIFERCEFVLRTMYALDRFAVHKVRWLVLEFIYPEKVTKN